MFETQQAQRLKTTHKSTWSPTWQQTDNDSWSTKICCQGLPQRGKARCDIHQTMAYK